ncbi:hypothetical protein RF11_04085 [Thelohanellus kitauei]|uniref:Uncharacterized protein n=1 Tax=Thelohanellus kitauei TaxID=669202 RepID=A0A0C2N6E8_THEKT|nr:hypothetical protein RF11_04085 [Thelohanellus kitauei]
MRDVGDLITEILLFLNIISEIKGYLRLRESQGLSDVKFDVFEHMEELNTKIRGNDIFSHQMYSAVMAIKLKIKMFCRQLSHNITTHFLKLENMAQQITSIGK